MEGKGKRPSKDDLEELKRSLKREVRKNPKDYPTLYEPIINYNALDQDDFLYNMLMGEEEEIEDVEKNNLKGGNNMFYDGFNWDNEKNHIPSIDSNFQDIREECEERKSSYNPSYDFLKSSKRKNVEELPASLRELVTVLNHEHFSFDPAVGREKEMHELMRAVVTPEKSALLIGEPGVGKTSIVRGLAYKIKCGNVPNLLRGYTIFETSAARLNSGCSLSGMLEKRIISLFEYLKRQEDVIIFIDELHTLIGTGKGTGHESLDVANMIKPYLSSGDVILVGATTKGEYEEFIMEDPAFKERFKVIDIAEPDNDSLRIILHHALDRYCSEYKLKMSGKDSEKIIENLIRLTGESKRNIYDYACNPRLAIGIIGEAVAEARLSSSKEIVEEYFKSAYDSNVHVNGEYVMVGNTKLNNNAKATILYFSDFKKKNNKFKSC